jgi:trimeric autotransporter adhesin
MLSHRRSPIYVARLLLACLVLASGLAAQNPPATPGTPPVAPQAAPPPVQTPGAPYGEITGTVKSGTTPLPGVTITAANSLTGKKYVTSSDVDGSFKLTVTGKGRYVVRAEFSAFAPITQELVINDENRKGKADLSMILISRAEKEAQQEQQKLAQQGGAANGGGMQRLQLSGRGDQGGDAAGGGSADTSSLASAGLPNAGLAAEGSNESVAVSGNMGRNEQQAMDPGEMQDRLADLRDQLTRQGGGTGSVDMGGGRTGNLQILGGGGGFGGGGGGDAGAMVFMMGGGGRGGRGFNVNKPHGSLFYTYGGSAFDAKPFSLNGQPEDKSDYNQNRFGATIGGPLNIPHIYHGGTKTFAFANYSGSRSTNAYDVFSTVPTLAERNGDFSSLPTQLFNPVTHTPFLNNQIPVNPIAAQLLKFIPAPNLPGPSRNFHFVSASPTSSDTVLIRLNHSFGADQGILGAFGVRRQQRQQQQQQGKDKKKEKTKWSQSINGGFIFNDVHSTILNPFPGLGGNSTSHNYNANFGYTAVKGLFSNSLRFIYNHASTTTLNNFTDINNIEGQLGINGVSNRPADFGLPVLSFAPEFSGLQDLTPAFRTNQTFTISDSMSLSHKKHSFTWGGDFRRLLYDVTNANNARGTFTFTGAATSGATVNGSCPPPNPANPVPSCAPFADFLTGFAQQTSIQFGAQDYHFRADSWDLYFQDNWRISKNFTANLGLRYEYVTPYVEGNNQLVNLDVAPNFSAVAPVMPGQIGPITGKKFPDGLIRPDRNNFAPRVGLAWKPFSKTVVRAGYGMNYNLAQYGLMATQFGFQPPFAVAQNNSAPATNLAALSLQNGFPATTPSPNHITNTYAVDPNYRLAYVQTWNLNIQQEIKGGIILNIGYTGSKGTHLDIVTAPDQTASGAPIFNQCLPTTPLATSCVSPFLFESSEGSSILHAGSVRVRKRLRHGLSVGGTYTFAKSIDNASSIGGGGTVVAQNSLDLAAERGLSSFDQRHRFTADYQYELPFGKEKRWLKTSGFAQKAFGGFSLNGNMTMASGTPFSPRFFGGASDIGRGVSGSARPNVVPGQSLGGDHTILNWFNTSAFTAPSGPFGNAGRNIIIGPGTISCDMALSKTIQIKEMQNLELRLSATNVFNHANFSSIDTTLGSPTFGQVVAAGAMRKGTFTARYRF